MEPISPVGCSPVSKDSMEPIDPVGCSPVSPDHGSSDHGSSDHGSIDHGSSDHGSSDHGSSDHGSSDHGSIDSRHLGGCRRQTSQRSTRIRYSGMCLHLRTCAFLPSKSIVLVLTPIENDAMNWTDDFMNA